MNNIVDQVLAVGELAVNVATFGASSTAIKSVKFAEKMTEFKEALEKAQKASEQLRNAIQKADAFNTAGESDDLFAMLNSGSVEDQALAAAEIAAFFEPTGILGLALAFNHPVCSEIS